MSDRVITCDDNNIKLIRDKHPEGLHFVAGDTHGELPTLMALMEKIEFDPHKDHVYFVGDYNGGGDPYSLLGYMSGYYQPDYERPGFHLIRGNHERELYPVYPLENLPDIIVIRGRQLNYYIVHAGMVSGAFHLINEDMAKTPDRKVYAYRLDNSCAEYDAPFRQIIWSRRGLYSQRSRWKNWPSERDLAENRACIIHGHTPYCFFLKNYFSYGDNSVFWQKQHIFFSEDLQSFNIDSNIKGRYENGESYRGLACVCLEVCEETAAQNGGRLSADAIGNSPNAVFSAEYQPYLQYAETGNIDRILNAAPRMKTIKLDCDGKPVIAES